MHPVPALREILPGFHDRGPAEESRSPVVLLLDGFLAHLSETVDLDRVSVEIKPRTLAPLGHGNRHFTGLLAKNGVPLTKDSLYYREWYGRVKTKMLETAMNYRFYEYLKNDQADTLLIAYGIVFRVILPLKKEFSLFKPVALFPVLEKEIRAAASGHKRIVVIEMNDGQYRGEVQKVLPREVLGISVLGGTISADLIYSDLKIENPIIDEADVLIKFTKNREWFPAKALVIDESLCDTESLECSIKSSEGTLYGFENVALSEFGSKIYINMIALGRILRYIGINILLLNIKDLLPSKSVEKNLEAVKYGFNYRDDI